MKGITPGLRLSLFLLLTCGVLGAMLALEWRTTLRSGTQAVAEPPPAASGNPLPDRMTYTAPAIASFDEILERPLFTEGREPPPEPEPAAVPVAIATPLRLQLEGVAISTGARVAVVRDLSNNELIRIAEGDKHQGWTVESVQPTGATFSRGKETRELSMELDENAPARRR